MKPIYQTFLLLITCVTVLQAQDTTRFTLEECVQYALENSVDVKNAHIDEQIAQSRVRETTGIGLPQIDGSVQLQHNEKLQRMFFTVDPTNPFTSEFTDIPAGSVIGTANFFQLKSNGNASVTINQLIFNGSYLVGLQAAKAYKDLAYKTTNQTREQVIVQVRKAYFAALINNERIKLFDANIARVDSLLRNTRALFQNGFAESIDVDRVEVTRNNLLTERNNFVNLQTLSLELLKFQMNYPMDKAIALEGDIKELEVMQSVDSLKREWSYEERSDYAVLMANQRLQELNLKNKYAEALPSLSAFANLGYSTQSQTIGGLFKTETDIEDNGIIGPDKWYSYSGFGLTLNIPIFSGLQRTYRVQQEKLELLKIENSFRTLKSSIDLQIKQALTTYQNNMEILQSQKRNMELSENIVRITRIKYEQGVGTNLEVIEAESDLREAQVNYYNALYDALVAEVELENAYGKILENYNVTTETK